MKVWISILRPQACDPHLIFMNHKDSTYRTTFVYVVIAIASQDQTRDTSRVLGWGALAFIANHAGGKEVNEARRSHTFSRSCTFKEKKKPEKNEKIRPTENTPRKPQQPGNHDRLNTACIETRPTPSPTLIRGLWKSAWYSSRKQ